ncbi:hypothetical protein Aduo_008923 [Ancylostoma duodenale]
MGDNDAERLLCLETKRKEQVLCRPKLYRALQKALRDIRAYQYEDNAEARIFNWIPNGRKAEVPRTEHPTILVEKEDTVVYEEL